MRGRGERIGFCNPLIQYLCNLDMSSRKKPKTSSSKEPDEPLECINYIRECAVKNLVNYSGRKKGGHVNSDIEQNFREVRALLNINAEIFARCMDSVEKGFTGTNAVFSRSGLM